MKKYAVDFEEAKEELIYYWENRLSDAKRNLKEIKKLKQ